MPRHRKSDLDQLVEVVTKLPWWVGLLLALISYLTLHSIASRPIMPNTVVPEQIGTAAVGGLLVTLAMFGQMIFPAVFLLGAFISGIKSLKQKHLYNKVEARTDVSALNEMTWEDFEMLIGEYYRRQGFQVTREGGNGPDGGIDLVLRLKSELHLVQCKQWRAFKVGVQPVREFYGVMAARGAAAGYFVTSGVFTEEAEKFVSGLNLKLIDGVKLRAMIDEARKVPAKDMSRKELGPKAVQELSGVAERLSLPVCSRCGAGMVKRIAKEGVRAGKEFWGCSNFPECHGTRDIEEKSSDWLVADTGQAETAASVSLTKSCPECRAEMNLRQFQTGQKAGQYYYGCPECKKGWPVSEAVRCRQHT